MFEEKFMISEEVFLTPGEFTPFRYLILPFNLELIQDVRKSNDKVRKQELLDKFEKFLDESIENVDKVSLQSLFKFHLKPVK
jgi:hypothetical protein